MSENEVKKSFVSYESTHRLRHLLLVTTIVPSGQSQAIIELNNKNEAAMCVVSIGKGTLPPELHTVLMPTEKREVIFSILREDCWPAYKKQLEERFAVSKLSKGIAYTIPVDSVAGVSIYKMLSNTRMFEKPINIEKKKGRKRDE